MFLDRYKSTCIVKLLTLVILIVVVLAFCFWCFNSFEWQSGRISCLQKSRSVIPRGIAGDHWGIGFDQCREIDRFLKSHDSEVISVIDDNNQMPVLHSMELGWQF